MRVSLFSPFLPLPSSSSVSSSTPSSSSSHSPSDSSSSSSLLSSLQHELQQHKQQEVQHELVVQQHREELQKRDAALASLHNELIALRKEIANKAAAINKLQQQQHTNISQTSPSSSPSWPSSSSSPLSSSSSVPSSSVSSSSDAMSLLLSLPFCMKSKWICYELNRSRMHETPLCNSNKVSE